LPGLRPPSRCECGGLAPAVQCITCSLLRRLPRALAGALPEPLIGSGGCCCLFRSSNSLISCSTRESSSLHASARDWSSCCPASNSSISWSSSVRRWCNSWSTMSYLLMWGDFTHAHGSAAARLGCRLPDQPDQSSSASRLTAGESRLDLFLSARGWLFLDHGRLVGVPTEQGRDLSLDSLRQ
jgi:hypothetical protein